MSGKSDTNDSQPRKSSSVPLGLGPIGRGISSVVWFVSYAYLAWIIYSFKNTPVEYAQIMGIGIIIFVSEQLKEEVMEGEPDAEQLTRENESAEKTL